MISEIAVFEASDADVNLENPRSHFKETIQRLLTTVLAVKGAKSAFYGQLVERAQIIVVIINWDSLESHIKFTQWPGFSAYLASFHTLVKTSSPATVYHVPFGDSQDPSPALETTSASPIGATEIILTYFPSPLSGTTKDDVMASFNKFKPVFASNGALFVIDGWAVEDNVETPVMPQNKETAVEEGKSESGQKSSVHMHLVAWESVDAHKQVLQGEDYKANIHYFTDVKEMKGAEVYHAKFFKFNT
ncbi:MAG: hypothetical protein Q9197_001168 [Variospora fuerteventurae]